MDGASLSHNRPIPSLLLSRAHYRLDDDGCVGLTVSGDRQVSQERPVGLVGSVGSFNPRGCIRFPRALSFVVVVGGYRPCHHRLAQD
eukprot:scaffold10_cov257-Pinguiococcus_pyrenoidosus.AAC.19